MFPGVHIIQTSETYRSTEYNSAEFATVEDGSFRETFIGLSNEFCLGKNIISNKPSEYTGNAIDGTLRQDRFCIVIEVAIVCCHGVVTSANIEIFICTKPVDQVSCYLRSGPVHIDIFCTFSRASSVRLRPVAIS